MSNYVKTTDFASKDALPSGNPLKAVKGADLGLEFDNIVTMSATKVDSGSNASLLSLTFTGSTIPANGLYLPSANTLGFATNSLNVGTIGATGAWSIPAPTAAVSSLTLSGPANSNAALLQGNITTNQSFGLRILSGTSSSDYALRCDNQANGQEFFLVRGDGLTQATDQGGTMQDVGWRDAPNNTQNGAYSFALSDRGKSVTKSGGSGSTWTIPANASVAFPIGTVILLASFPGAISNTIAITTDTLVWSPAGTTGSRTLAGGGMATLLKIGATEWMISGTGLS